MTKDTRNVGLAFLLSLLIVTATASLSYYYVLVPAQSNALLCALQ